MRAQVLIGCHGGIAELLAVRAMTRPASHRRRSRRSLLKAITLGRTSVRPNDCGSP
jgi:hypothetical protein